MTSAECFRCGEPASELFGSDYLCNACMTDSESETEEFDPLLASSAPARRPTSSAMTPSHRRFLNPHRASTTARRSTNSERANRMTARSSTTPSSTRSTTATQACLTGVSRERPPRSASVTVFPPRQSSPTCATRGPPTDRQDSTGKRRGAPCTTTTERGEAAKSRSVEGAVLFINVLHCVFSPGPVVRQNASQNEYNSLGLSKAPSLAKIWMQTVIVHVTISQ